MNAIAGIAVALEKAAEPGFRVYAESVLANARALADALLAGGATLLAGGTDNHMLVVDVVASLEIDGRLAERTLDRVGITTDKQIIPDDPNPPLRPSGIRLGTRAASERGMGMDEMRAIGAWILAPLRERDQAERIASIAEAVEALCTRFPVPGL